MIVMDHKTIAIEGLRHAFEVYVKDLEALPEDAIIKSPGGKARTVADFTYEVIEVNDKLCAVMRGEETGPWPEGWTVAPDHLNSKSALIEAFRAAADRTLAAAESYDESGMTEPIEGPRGPTTRFQRFQFMSMHTMYHCAQVNYVQCLMGDDAWHWG